MYVGFETIMLKNKKQKDNIISSKIVTILQKHLTKFRNESSVKSTPQLFSYYEMHPI